MNGFYFDSSDIFCKSPFGAIERGGTVEFRVKCDSFIGRICLIADNLTGDGRIVAELSRYADGVYGCSVYFVETGLWQYVFTDDTFESDCFRVTVYDENYRQPRGFAGGIMYQIFPDRFNIGGERLPDPFGDRRFHNNLSDVPNFRPDADGILRNNDYFGGNLKGIEQKLDYLYDLGIGAIYLNPIFESHSNHRYDTADYLKIDPLLGDEGNLRSLCAKAAEKGIKIIADGVFSHTGADSIYFNRYHRYGADGAFVNPDSRYAEWYSFDESGGYRSWWGFENLPEVDEKSESFIEFICGEGGVLEHWLDVGVGGFRLDVADELPDEFIAEIRSTIKRKNPDALLIGEVWEDASDKISYGVRRRYLLGDELDSVMNYPFRDAIIGFVKTADDRTFWQKIMPIIEHYPKPMTDVMMNMLSTHDTARVITALVSDGDGDREWQSRQHLDRDEYLRGVELVKLAFALCFTLPGMPCIYYGDEAGMQGWKDPFNRGFFCWNDIDENIRDFVKELSRIRRSYSAFADGELVRIEADDGCVAYLRRNADSAVLTAVNRSQSTVRINVGGQIFDIPPWRSLIETIL